MMVAIVSTSMLLVVDPASGVCASAGVDLFQATTTYHNCAKMRQVA